MRFVSRSLLLVDMLVVLALAIVVVSMLFMAFSSFKVATPPAEEGAVGAWVLGILENTDMSRHSR